MGKGKIIHCCVHIIRLLLNLFLFPDFKEAVTKAQSNEVEIEVFKVVLLGPPEAGKTQLARALVGDYHEVTESTPISTGAKVVVQRYVASDKFIWQPLTKDVFQQSLHSTAFESMKDKPPQPKPHQNEPPQSSSAKTKEPLKHIQEIMKPDGPIQEHHSVSEASIKTHLAQSHGSSAHKQGKSVSQAHSESESDQMRRSTFRNLLKGVAECCKAYDADKTLHVSYVHLIDNGGQPAFFDAHPVFATSRATYLLVYNMLEGLQGKPQYTYRMKGQKYEPIKNESCTNLEIINTSLMTIISLKEKFKAAEKHLMHSDMDDSAKHPLVLVVGTHFDSMHKEEVKQQGTDLHEECRFLFPAWNDAQPCTLFGKESDLFPVESLNKNCEGVKQVREKAIPEGHGLKMKIPIKWFHCHLLFWHAKEEKTESGENMYPGLEVLLFSTLYNLCRLENLISDERELLDMVRAFHVLGLFYFPALDQEQKEGWSPNNHPVFTNPDLLYGELTKILEVTFKDRLREDGYDASDRRYFRPLKEGGELTVEVMKRLGIPHTVGELTPEVMKRLGMPNTLGELTPEVMQRLGIPDFRSYLLDLLSHWGLAAIIPKEDAMNDAEGPTAFIPCVLTPCNKTLSPHDVQPMMQSLTVFFTISKSKPGKWYYLPSGVFTHFVVNLLRSSEKYKRPKDPGKVYCYRDSVPLVRHEVLGVEQRYVIRVGISNKSIEACISQAQKDTEAHPHDPHDLHDFQVVIWEELKPAMEKACKDLYHKDLTVTVATDCPCNEFGPHLAELCADSKTYCLLGEDVRKVKNQLLKDILKAQPTGMCYAHSILLFTNRSSSTIVFPS